jgi:Uma2 family endonuclease
MQTMGQKRLFTADEYLRMGEAGILKEGDRVELINGEIIRMSPIGIRHIACVDRANMLFAGALQGRAIVSVQNPVRLSEYTEPQPDIVILRPRADYYSFSRHTPADVFLMIEVADSSLEYDSQAKLLLYALSGISEVWIEDLRNDQLLVHRNPEGDRYTTSQAMRRGDSISPLAFPDLTTRIEDLLG